MRYTFAGEVTPIDVHDRRQSGTAYSDWDSYAGSGDSMLAQRTTWCGCGSEILL